MAGLCDVWMDTGIHGICRRMQKICLPGAYPQRIGVLWCFVEVQLLVSSYISTLNFVYTCMNIPPTHIVSWSCMIMTKWQNPRLITRRRSSPLAPEAQFLAQHQILLETAVASCRFQHLHLDDLCTWQYSILDSFLFQQGECTNQYESISQQSMCPVRLEDPIFPPIATPEIKDLGSATRESKAEHLSMANWATFKTLVTFHWILIGSRGILLIYTGLFQITRLFGAQFTLNWLFHYICCVCMVSLRWTLRGTQPAGCGVSKHKWPYLAPRECFGKKLQPKV